MKVTTLEKKTLIFFYFQKKKKTLTDFLTRSLARDIIILLKSSIKLSIKKTPKVAAKGVFCACSRHSG